MTYGVGLMLREGVVLLADTRTNAGVDNISVFGKLHLETVPGERALALLTAGNLAITQQVWSRLREGITLDGLTQTLRDVPTMFRAAQLVGAAVRAVFAADGAALSAQGIGFDAALLLGGQIAGGEPRLFLIYAAGNFIEATADTPFLQVGEHKYGKPILDRALDHATTTLADGIKLVLVSMDSTLRSNLTVGLPIDLAVLPTDEMRFSVWRRIEADDPYFNLVRADWARALGEAYREIPPPDWLE
jgi:putative proteasome-type protease